MRKLVKMKKRLVYLLLSICLVFFATGLSFADLVWESKSSMGTGKQSAFSGVANGKLYVLGGDDGIIGELDVVESYDPLTDSWQYETPLPQKRCTGASATLDEKIYMFGGDTWHWILALDWVWAYDPSTGKTETGLSPMPTPRRYTDAIVAGRFIYVIGGFDASFTPLSTVEIYDVDNDTWTTGPDMPTARGILVCEKVGDKIYAMGGLSGGQYLNTVEVLSISPDGGTPGTWETLPDACTPRSCMASVAIGPQIYLIGGEIPGSYTSIVEVYDTTTGTCISEQPIPEKSQNLDVEQIDGIIYAFGGDRVEGYSPSSEKLDAAEVLIPASIDIDPNTLNMKSQGEYITCHIDLPQGFSLSNIDITTVGITKIANIELAPPIFATGSSAIGTYDADGISYLMVKFDRQLVISELSNPGNTEFVVRGEFLDSIPFEGSDTIRVINRGK